MNERQRFLESLIERHISEAATALTCAFAWQYSDEGDDYWREVESNLFRYQALAQDAQKRREKHSGLLAEIADLKRKLAELEDRVRGDETSSKRELEKHGAIPLGMENRRSVPIGSDVGPEF